MKKIYTYISLVALAAISAGCAKELVNPEDLLTDSNKAELVNGELTVQLSVPASANTKTVLGLKNGDTYPVYWSPEDVITLNGTAATEFTPSDDNKTATAKFKLASLTAPYNFLYGGVSGTSNQVSFPSTQNYVEGSFDPAAMPMYASVNDLKENVTFSHVASLLKFSFTGTNQISSVTLTAADKSKSLSGNFTLNTTDGTLTPVSGNASLVYNLGGDKQLSQTPFVFYVAVPAGTYTDGITLEILDNDSGHMTVKVMNTEESNTIAAGKVREFENVVYTPSKELNLIQISSEATLKQFASRVAAGETTLNARVLADFTVSSSWTPVEDYKGIFEGNSKTISGLNQPLFNVLGGVVKNLTLNSTITATDADDRNWGMFAKQLYPSIDVDDVAGLQNCIAKGSLTYTPSSALSADCQIGGLVGNNKGGAVSNCTNEATVTVGDNGESNASQTSVGGVVGRTQKGGDLSTQGDISDCTNKGTVVCDAKLSENLYIGGVLGYQVEKAEYISGCVNNGLVKVGATFSTTKALQLGGVIGIGKGKIESCTNGSEGTVTSEAGSTGGTYICQGGVVGRLNNDANRVYSGLTNAGNINVAAAGASSGSYIGGMVGRCDEGASLSDCTNTGGTLEYTGATSTCPLHIGGIVGQSKGGVTSCTNATAINVGGEYALNSSGKYLSIGGVVGRQNANVEISNNINTAAVTFSGTSTGYTALGGIVGYCDGPISGGENSGTVSFTGSSNSQNCPIGGIAARTPGSKSGDRITGVKNSGNIIINTTTQTKKELFVGGIVGHHQSANVSATNTGKVEVTSLTCSLLSLGGIVGKADGSGLVSGNNEGEIVTGESCTINGDIYMGGVVGQARMPVESSVNSGAIISGGSTTAKQSYLQVGGVVGWSHSAGPISDCQNAGNVTNTGNSNGFIYVGGVTSESAAEISNSYNTATITNSGECAGSYTENDVKKCCDNSVGGVAGVNNNTTFTSCYNTGEVINTGYSGGGIFVGGVAGKSKAGTFVTCYNTGAVTNEGQAYDSLVACDVAIGGVAGYLTEGANILTGTESAYNYNNGTITDSSVSTYVGIAGCVGFVNGEGSELSYLKNLSDGDVRMNNNDRIRLFVGGTVGCSHTPSITMDYASNAGEVKFTAITISTAVYVGGVLGGFYAANDDQKEWELTFTGLTNSGQIACWNATNGGNMAAKSKSATGYSYIGGISGVGDNYSKDFFNCTNTGRIAVYNQLKTRLGGVLGYTNHNPDGCVNKGRINYCRYNPMGNGGSGEIGGVVGYMNIETPTNLTNDANVRSTGSSPNCYTGGIVGRTNAATVGFLNCKVGSTGGEGTISGAGENAFSSTAAGLFCSDGNSSHAWDFTGCLIKNGTKCSKVTVSEDKFTDMLVGRNHASSITNAPTIVDSF